MISVKKALELVDITTSKTSEIDSILVTNALGYILASNIYSPINMPPFRQSAMDGYALCLHSNHTYKLIGEVKTGDATNPNLQPGDAVRIFTGAPVPDRADAVIVQEKVYKQDKFISFDDAIKTGTNIRVVGEQIKKNSLALPINTKITPAIIAFLTSLGITEVNVYKKPSIAIIVTGNELISPGTPLQHGQIYESNAIMLKSVLKSTDFNADIIPTVEDDYEKTFNTLNIVIQKYDFVLISGGISVGDYDFVGKALESLEVEKLFYKVNQKPGKPLFFGKKGNTSIFALPGNPASALTCCYVYVLPALRKKVGYINYFLEKKYLKSNHDYNKRDDKKHFLKAYIKDDHVSILEGQASSMIHSYTTANALIVIQEETNIIKAGTLVEVILLP